MGSETSQNYSKVRLVLCWIKPIQDKKFVLELSTHKREEKGLKSSFYYKCVINVMWHFFGLIFMWVQIMGKLVEGMTWRFKQNASYMHLTANSGMKNWIQWWVSEEECD